MGVGSVGTYRDRVRDRAAEGAEAGRRGGRAGRRATVRPVHIAARPDGLTGDALSTADARLRSRPRVT